MNFKDKVLLITGGTGSFGHKNLGHTQIVAPMSGTVISITTKQGQTVNANQTAPTIVTLAQLDKVRIKAKISEADVVNLRAGMPVYFAIINPDKKFQAALTAIRQPLKAQPPTKPIQAPMRLFIIWAILTSQTQMAYCASI